MLDDVSAPTQIVPSTLSVGGTASVIPDMFWRTTAAILSNTDISTASTADWRMPSRLAMSAVEFPSVHSWSTARSAGVLCMSVPSPGKDEGEALRSTPIRLVDADARERMGPSYAVP
jgi:hypothetical protein